MKLYILTDLEGATAVTGGWDLINPGCREFEHAKKMLTGDINACVRGAFDAGATEIVVLDGHGMANSVFPTEVDSRIRLIQGRAIFSVDPIPVLDKTFDALIILGMHAMEGTSDGVMNSTVYSPARFWINNREVGETGLFAAVAAEMGVPVIMVTGDEAVCREARELITGVYTTAVKKGLSRYSAVIVPPQKAWEMITDTTREAVTNYKSVSIFETEYPVEVKMEIQGNTQLVDCVARIPGVKRVNGYTLSYKCNSMKEALGALIYLMPFMLGD